ncbi:hypothetical protein BDV98DRAFT_571232 [Pterulicium gracile]|uniref:Uncharacterized protein n=1 Tax=Pterulicium gracile TaxID=1884261 RepID=A0A5C3QMK0_9AGAR|nr:hypothetical protein BDV98DRAFT_571232 [Pterula gracilis]
MLRPIAHYFRVFAIAFSRLARYGSVSSPAQLFSSSTVGEVLIIRIVPSIAFCAALLDSFELFAH